MTIIEYHRYTVNEDKSIADSTTYVEQIKDDDTDIVRIEGAAVEWLTDHYGHVDIYSSDYTPIVIDNKNDLLIQLKS